MKFYLEKRILTAFVVVMLVLTSLGYLSFVNSKEFAKTSALVSNTNEVLFHLQQSQSVAFEMEMLILKYIISGDTSFVNLYVKQAMAGSDHVKKIDALTLNDSVQQVNLDTLRSLGRRKINYNKLVIQQRKISAEAAQKLIPSARNAQIQNKIIATIERMKKNETDLMDSRIEQSEISYKKFNATLSVLLVFVIVLLCLVMFTMNKNLYARTLAERRTQQINKELEAFTYSVSHDLRAPLRSIDGYAKVLLEDYGNNLDAEGHQVLKIIMNNAKKMGKLIDDLLEFSRINRKEISKGIVDMQSLVQNIINEYPADIQSKIKVANLHTVKGDFSMLQQVWVNLINNAIKYSSKKPDASIEINSVKGADTITYTVKDNGVGFDMQYVHKLFGVFQRLHKSKDFEGTGVGLALVQRIIQKHDGRVWAEAAVGKGATFYFSLPA
jgi:signal transduction histidine kinase